MEDYKYLTIVEWAKNYITSKGLRPRDRFLTEKELCEIHGVSRQTVRQALMCLENDNVICRVRGSGAFVSNGISQNIPASQVQTRNIGVISTYFTDYIFPQNADEFTERFAFEIGTRVFLMRSKTTPENQRRLLLTGILQDENLGGCGVCLGGFKFTFSDLFDMFDVRFGEKDWQPFGVEEASE